MALLKFNGKTLIDFVLLQITEYGTKMAIFTDIVVISIITQCAAISLQEQLEHVARRQLESQKYVLLRRLLQNQDDENDDLILRRFYAPGASIIGTPSLPSHLPAAEPILPGHTLLRPSLGMLKSAVKFPHRELENGAGVYGNIDNLGIRYDGLNERLLYTGFRRVPADYIMVLPQRSNGDQKSVVLIGAPVTFDSERFSPDPTSLKEILQNRAETERAVNEFFKKAKVDRQKPFGNLKSRDDDKPLQALRFGADIEGDSDVDQPQKLMAVADENSSSSTSEERPKIQGDSDTEEVATEFEDKKTWFAKTKNAYNHVKYSNHAPDLVDYMPIETDDFDGLRNWWFYNQDDFKAFKDFDSDIEIDNTPKPNNKVNKLKINE